MLSYSRCLGFCQVEIFKGAEDLSKIENKKGGSKTASPVNVFIAKKQTFSEEIVSSGTALANEEASLMPEVAGKVIRIYFS